VQRRPRVPKSGVYLVTATRSTAAAGFGHPLGSCRGQAGQQLSCRAGHLTDVAWAACLRCRPQNFLARPADNKVEGAAIVSIRCGSRCWGGTCGGMMFCKLCCWCLLRCRRAAVVLLQG
jgi:hypothetical protein